MTRGDHEARVTTLLATAQLEAALALAAATAVDGLDPEGRRVADVAGTKFSSG